MPEENKQKEKNAAKIAVLKTASISDTGLLPEEAVDMIIPKTGMVTTGAATLKKGAFVRRSMGFYKDRVFHNIKNSDSEEIIENSRSLTANYKDTISGKMFSVRLSALAGFAINETKQTVGDLLSGDAKGDIPGAFIVTAVANAKEDDGKLRYRKVDYPGFSKFLATKRTDWNLMDADQREVHDDNLYTFAFADEAGIEALTPPTAADKIEPIKEVTIQYVQ